MGCSENQDRRWKVTGTLMWCLYKGELLPIRQVQGGRSLGHRAGLGPENPCARLAVLLPVGREGGTDAPKAET